MTSQDSAEQPCDDTSKPERAHAQSYVGGQLEPDNYLLEYTLRADEWATLAVIHVGEVSEAWIVDHEAAGYFGKSVTALRLTQIAPTTHAPVSNPLRETTPTVVTWTAATGALYPTTGYTFEGEYQYPGDKGTLALNLQMAQIPGGSAIALSYWFNPDPSGSPISLDLSLSIVMSLATGSAYTGNCYTTSSTYAYTP